MGFIEELRRQRELEKQQEEEGGKEAKRLEAIRQSEPIRLNEEAIKAEKERQEQLERDIKKAQEYFDKSDFPQLAKELNLVDKRIVLCRGIVHSDSWSIADSYKKGFAVNSNDNNPFSSIGLTLIWHVGETFPYKKRDDSDYIINTHDEIYNFITIGCDQLGTITLRKRWGDIKLPLSKWLGNPDIQEESLGKAYKRAREVRKEVKNMDRAAYRLHQQFDPRNTEHQ